MSNIEHFLQQCRTRADNAVQKLLPVDKAYGAGNTNAQLFNQRLNEAMRYAVTGGGKRIRPCLTYATCKALGIPFERMDVPAAAIELVHAYSLVHDDLPAMDDDDLRRGKPTCHRQFDEATAILAGDALQALAFTVLAENDDATISTQNKLDMVLLLGKASGEAGMAAGQAIDLESVGEVLSLQELEAMHRLKTGRLIHASILMATLTHEGCSDELSQRLSEFANEIGLLFQIVDDILDVVSDTETLGKTQGADGARNKPTYPALLGLEGARQHASQTHERALQPLEGLGPQFDELRQISSFIIERTH